MKRKYLFLVCFIISNLGQAQIRYFDTMTAELKQIASEESENGWIKFRITANLNAATIFENNRIAFGLSKNDTVKVAKVFKDDLEMTHYNYIQYYNGIPIDGESVNVHQAESGQVVSATGNLKTNLQLQTVHSITKNQAIDLALRFVNAKEYMWQSTFFENELKQKYSNPDTTYYPQTHLVIKEKQSYTGGTGIFYLAYRMDIYSASPFYAQRIFIDANSGEIVEKYPLQSN